MRKRALLLCLALLWGAILLAGTDAAAKKDPVASHWQISTWINPGTGNGLWCGALYAPCSPSDPPQGYGNNWTERVDFVGSVPDPSATVKVRVQALLNYDIEPDYDYIRLQVEREGIMENVIVLTSKNRDYLTNVFTPYVVDETFWVTVLDSKGKGKIHLRWEFTSDTGWSDADCSWPTWGACALDNIVVSVDDVVISTTDFDGDPPTMGDWSVPFSPPGQEAAKAWPQLDAPDPVFAARSYPNPFNPKMTIAYSLPQAGVLTVRIFNVRGELVRTLFDGIVTAREGSLEWDGVDDQGKGVESGVYFYEVASAGHRTVNRATLLK